MGWSLRICKRVIGRAVVESGVGPFLYYYSIDEMMQYLKNSLQKLEEFVELNLCYRKFWTT